MIRATLCFVFRGNPHQNILLGYKKRGFGQGKYGGFGGKVHNDEDLLQAASRELYEEAGITTEPTDLEPFGVLTFIFPFKPAWDHEVHIFVVGKWQGIPAESEEMRPQWFALTGIPLYQMWDDTHYWLPHVLAGQKINAHFTFNEDNETVKDYSILLL